MPKVKAREKKLENNDELLKLFHGALLLNHFKLKISSQKIFELENEKNTNSYSRFFISMNHKNKLKYGPDFKCYDFCCNEKAFLSMLCNYNFNLTEQVKEDNISNINEDNLKINNVSSSNEIHKIPNKKIKMDTLKSKPHIISKERTKETKKTCTVCNRTKTSIWSKYKGKRVCNPCKKYFMDL
ncbi:hypothetical protein SLOPH_910 [Spraguea lophii 42_110]|uniref:GATA-type domain-containing protein n=1 Tax=Spraguea lophii (strain 42_110) TaxID=1358809 RepID=S7WAZ7_SPRLO|nr:hypothetical protein SLOPH_910 [Spraguea lophii 42_110]